MKEKRKWTPFKISLCLSAGTFSIDTRCNKCEKLIKKGTPVLTSQYEPFMQGVCCYHLECGIPLYNNLATTIKRYLKTLKPCSMPQKPLPKEGGLR